MTGQRQACYCPSAIAARANSSRELGVAAVTERTVLRVLAATPGHQLGFGQVHPHGREAGASVRTIAERLLPGLAAGAPRERAGSSRLHKRASLNDVRVRHTQSGQSCLSDARDFVFCRSVSHHATSTGPKQNNTPIGMQKMLQNLSIIQSLATLVQEGALVKGPANKGVADLRIGQ